jgi:hypothetical protein
MPAVFARAMPGAVRGVQWKGGIAISDGTDQIEHGSRPTVTVTERRYRQMKARNYFLAILVVISLALLVVASCLSEGHKDIRHRNRRRVYAD